MGVDGVRSLAFKRVVLDEFFDDPTWVDLRIISPMGRAIIKETLMGSFTIGELDSAGKASQIQTKTEGMAEREIKIRNLKLQYSYGNTNMKSKDVKVIWDQELWDELDNADPGIIEKIIKEIDIFSKLNAKEGDADPT